MRTPWWTLSLVLTIAGCSGDPAKEDAGTDTTEDAGDDATDVIDDGAIDVEPDGTTDVVDDGAMDVEPDGTPDGSPDGDVARNLTVRFSYDGSRPFTSITPLLYSTSMFSSCDSIFTPPLRNPDVLAAPSLRLPESVRDPETGEIPDAVVADLPEGATYVVVAYAPSDSDSAWVYGCRDTPASMGDIAVVPLTDAPTSIAGSFRLRSTLQLMAGLPTRSEPTGPMQAGDWASTVVDLFGDPGRSIVRLLWPSVETAFGADLPSGLEAVFEEMLTGTMAHQSPAWATHATEVGDDVREFAEDLPLGGEFTLPDEPDPGTGVLGVHSRHRYSAATFGWRFQCLRDGHSPTECADHSASLTFSELGRSDLSVDALWGGAVVPCAAGDRCLVVDAHDLSLRYGEILLAVIEGWMLPAVYEMPGDGLAALVTDVVRRRIREWYNAGRPPAEQVTDTSCRGVGVILARLAEGRVVAPASTVEDIGTFACDQACTDAVDLVVRQNAGLRATSSVTLASDGDCPLAADEDYLQYVWIGEADAPCRWSVRFTWDGGPPTDHDGGFHAARGDI